MMGSTRRKFLVLAAAAPAGFIAGARAMAGEAACPDPAALPLQQRNRRRSIGYVEVASEPGRHCSLCVFFKAGQGQCGTCEMLGGGPVSARGVCRSFAAKSV